MPRFQYPDGPQDHEGILTYCKDVDQAYPDFWHAVEMTAWRNILYSLGIQNIEYSRNLNFWRPLSPRARKPITNKVKPLVNDLSSKLVAFKPPITWGPGSDQEADYVAASVADRVNTALEREANIRELKPIAARWLAWTGNCFLVSNYDISAEWGTKRVDASRCLACSGTSMPADIQQAQGACPLCGLQAGWEPAIDETGTPVGIDYPLGKHLTELENVFTVRFDPQADRFHKSPYIRVGRMRPRSWIAEHYGDAFADQVRYGPPSTASLQLFESLSVTASGASLAFTGTAGSEDQAFVERLWIRPHPVKAPTGIYAEIVGDQIAMGDQGPVARDYPYHDERGRAMLNITQLEFDQGPSALASTRLDDVCGMQDDLNEYDAYMKIHARRMANAAWTLPRGSNVARITGEVGVMIQYDPLPTGHKPERLQGMDIPATIFNKRNMIKVEMDEVWGSMEVSRGEAPRGISAYAALQLLDERAQQGQSNLFDNWALGWMEWSRQNLNIYREYADEQRTLNLGFGRWSTKVFTNALMEGSPDMQVELGTNRPLTLIAKSARIGQAIQEHLLNVFDPQVQFLALRALGIPDLMPDYNAHFQKAGRIVSQIYAAQDPSQLPMYPPQPYDNHAVHLQVLVNAEVDESFDDLQPFQQQAIQIRAAMHHQALMEQMAQAAAGQNAMRPQGGDEGSNGAGGGGGSDKKRKPPYETEQGVLDKETQGASPNTLTGAAASAVTAGA